MYDLNTFHFYWKLTVSLEGSSRRIQKNHNKMQEFIKILILISLKTVYKML